jgi:ABC-type multidrug transport system fused ATPase/permease subunit
MNSVYRNLAFIWQDLMNDQGRRLARWTLVTVLLGAAVQIAAPYGLGLIVDALGKQSWELFLHGLAVYVCFEVLGSGVGWLRMRIRERLFQINFWHFTMRITERYFARPLGGLIGADSEIDGGGVESLKDKTWHVMGTYIFNIVPNYSLALFSALACMYVHIVLGVAACVYMCVDMFIGYVQNAYMHTRMKPVIDEFRRWERRIREWWHAVPVVKHNGVERRLIMQVKEEIQPALQADDRIWRVFFPWAILGRRTLGQCCAVGIYSIAGWYAISGVVSVAECVLLIFSFEKIRVVLEEINDLQREVARELGSIDTYRRVLTSPIPFHYAEGTVFDGGDIGVRFERVTLSLGEGCEKRLILRDASFAILPGERVGIVGPSGAGKSQLVNLILRSCDPDSGTVFINSSDLRTLSLESYLRFCGIIPQKSDLFEDSILGNVMFGVSQTDCVQTDVEVRVASALQKAGLDFGTRLTNGLYTKVGYKGMRLSGGQQARVCIAGAHFKLMEGEENRPRMIIADEPTASLDSLSEMAVMEHLTDALPKNTTVLMIAHRLSTVAGMDRIMFVRPVDRLREDEPQVTLHASLRELYASEPLFREMADAQNFQP